MGEWNAEAAEWYADKYGEYATNRLAIDRLELAAHTDIVDIGCGTGAALRHASARVTDGALIGVDLVPRMIEIARDRAKSHPAGGRLEFRVGSAESLPVDDDAADLVLAFDSYDHWRDTEAGFAEVLRVLRPGGRLAVVKDGGVPQMRDFRGQATSAGLDVVSEAQVEAEGVTFTLWVCTARP